MSNPVISAVKGVLATTQLVVGTFVLFFGLMYEVAGNSRRDEFDFPPINKEKAYDIIDVMAYIAKNHGVSVATVALSWVMRQPGVTSTIIGAKNLQQLTDNIAAVDLQLSNEEMEQLNQISTLPSEYPGWMVTRQLQGRYPE